LNVGPKLYLFDDDPDAFWPLSWTRPLGELLHGAETFRRRMERRSGLRVEGAFSNGRFEALSFSRLGAPPLQVNPAPPAGAPVLLLDSVYVPPPGPDPGPAFAPRTRPARFWLGERVVGAWLGPEDVRPVFEALSAHEEWREIARGAEEVELPGRRPAALHRLVARNADQIMADLGEGGLSPSSRSAADLAGSGIGVEGPVERLLVDPGVELAPPIHVDVREGPVWLEAGVRVEPFTVLRGPLVARAEACLLGGEIGSGSTMGPSCKVRGEIQNTIFVGFSNKAHEGFVGDSYVGEWVNLGAGTTTSNLKNNYGYVRLRRANDTLETGLLKLGALIGDHVKTGIGTLLPTGAYVGPGTNLYGTQGPAPAFLPAFSWGAGARKETHRLDAFLESARRVMERRGQVLDAEEVGMLGAVFRATEPDRIAG
jgi:UDP-N-acetylglucosamine diphosphorylase/glucosamine-1-phosphate N-acetyltransferase